MPARPLLLALFVAALAAGCAAPARMAPPAPSASASPAWDTFVAQFLDGYFATHPDAAVGAGKHQYDGQLPDWSADGLAREAARLHAERDRAAAFPEATLDERQRFERDYLLAVADGELFWREQSGFPTSNPSWYSGGVDPNVYTTRPYAPLDVRLRAFTAYAENIPRATAQIQANMQTPLPRTYVALGQLVFGGMASYLRDDVPGIFASVADPAAQARFRTANAAAIAAFETLSDWYKAQEPTATDAFALGPDRFQAMLLATERVDVPLERLTAIGRADLARNRAALREACAAFAPGATETACIAHAAALKPDGSPVEAARRQLTELRAFVESHNVVTIPGPEQALVEEAPPYARWNLAYINIPGPYEQNLPSVYYISPPDAAWTPAEQTAYLPGRTNLLFVSAHEVWPGHFLQFLHANRAQSKFGQVFVGYAFAEGWAHYAEEMMWEEGLGEGSPEVHIGQLTNALLRDVRYLSAIGLHTGGMTVAESERMFREEAFQDAGSARQQAARGTFDPAYLNYTLGKLMIRQLRTDWAGTRGGQAAWHDFHDRFLSFGGPPIPLVRRAMLGVQGGPAL